MRPLPEELFRFVTDTLEREPKLRKEGKALSKFGINSRYHGRDTVQNLTKDLAREIYDRYWQSVGGGRLDPLTSTALFLFSVNPGPARFAGLNASLGLEPVEGVTKETLDTLSRLDPETAFQIVWAHRLAALFDSANAEKYRRGYERRIEREHDYIARLRGKMAAERSTDKETSYEADRIDRFLRSLLGVVRAGLPAAGPFR